jgi:hypothetical protein
MPKNAFGQLITFAIETDADQKFSAYQWVNVKKGDTIQKIASRRGHPDKAEMIAELNNIRSVRAKFTGRGKKRILIPGTMRQADRFSVLAGDTPPSITGGYPKIEIIDRPSRTGLSQFVGYDPITMEVPIRFEAPFDRSGERSGADIEDDIERLERMAGRGNFKGAAVGPPAIIRISTTNNDGRLVPLIPRNYQWSRQNPNAPTWRIAGIEWDDQALRNDSGNRIRQLATVTAQQHTSANLGSRSVTERSKQKAKKELEQLGGPPTGGGYW